MKVFIVLCLVSYVFAEGDLGGYGGGHIAAAPIVAKAYHVNTGESQQYRSQDAAGNYKFGYDNAWTDGAWGSGAHSRHEVGDGWGNKEGSYSLAIGDGRVRKVSYVADAHGFRASIKTNEPGIVSSNPAAVDIHGPVGGHAGDLGHAAAVPVVATAVGGYSQGGYAGGLGAGLGGIGLAGGYAGGLAGGYAGGLAGGAGLGVGLAGGYAGGLAGGYAGGAGLGGAGLAGGYGGYKK